MRLLSALLLPLLLLAAQADQDPPKKPESLKGKEPPKLSSEKGTWLNADKPPTLAKLKGRAVLLVFTSVF